MQKLQQGVTNVRSHESRPIILCVDDDHTLRALYWMTLSSGGYDCIACESAEGALEMVKMLPIALATVDYDMPGRNGAELARTLRVMRPGMPLLLVSGNLHIDRRDVECFDGICIKGASPTCMVQSISQLLASASRRSI